MLLATSISPVVLQHPCQVVIYININITLRFKGGQRMWYATMNAAGAAYPIASPVAPLLVVLPER